MNSYADLENIWTTERITRFWDLVADEPRLQGSYFSLQHAKYIINLACFYGMSDGQILDYGCGPGFLSKELVSQGFRTTAVEFSRASVNRANSLINNQLNWKGCFVRDALPESVASIEFDWVFSIENFEHLREEWIDEYFNDLNGFLTLGGKLVITTPNSEVLDQELVICPCCEAKFHRWGHLRSVTPNLLSSIVQTYGFEVELCRAVNLRHMVNLSPSILDRLINFSLDRNNLIRDKISYSSLQERVINRRIKKINRPHLILIARKVE